MPGRSMMTLAVPSKTPFDNCNHATFFSLARAFILGSDQFSSTIWSRKPKACLSDWGSTSCPARKNHLQRFY